jgi:hypothetical protein
VCDFVYADIGGGDLRKGSGNSNWSSNPRSAKEYINNAVDRPLQSFCCGVTRVGGKYDRGADDGGFGWKNSSSNNN